jgi:hypothetical protein
MRHPLVAGLKTYITLKNTCIKNDYIVHIYSPSVKMNSLPCAVFTDEEIKRFKVKSMETLAAAIEEKKTNCLFRLDWINDAIASIGRNQILSFMVFSPSSKHPIREQIETTLSGVRSWALEKYHIELRYGGCDEGTLVSWKEVDDTHITDREWEAFHEKAYAEIFNTIMIGKTACIIKYEYVNKAHQLLMYSPEIRESKWMIPIIERQKTILEKIRLEALNKLKISITYKFISEGISIQMAKVSDVLPNT